jgi:hypothetical protein
VIQAKFPAASAGEQCLVFMAAMPKQLGPPPFDEADRSFARQIQATLSEQDFDAVYRSVGLPPGDAALCERVVPLNSPRQPMLGSTDVGDVSGVAVLGSEETIETRHVVQCWWRPDYRSHRSVVRGRRLSVLAGFQPSDPGVGLICRNVPTRRLILGPGGERVVPQLLTALLALDILLDRLAHEPSVDVFRQVVAGGSRFRRPASDW